VLATESGDYRPAIDHAGRALRVFDSLGAADSAIRAATVLGCGYRYLGDYQAARRYLDMAVGHWRTRGDAAKTAAALNNVAMLALDMSDFSQARRLLEESLMLKRAQGNPRSVALSLANLSDVYLKTGQDERAAEVLAEAASISAGLGDFQLTGTIACNQGDLARSRADFADAARHYRHALDCLRTSGNMHDVVLALSGLGVALHRLGQPAKAASLLREAESLTASTGNGNRLPEVRAALAAIGQPAKVPAPGGLTSRQAEILGYVASGLTTRQIADQLVLSTGTVDRHIATVYRKLGLANRAQAAGYALRHGLMAPLPR
jgi:ATP/maltotriose-dependent transcriptional regulator MalT